MAELGTNFMKKLITLLLSFGIASEVLANTYTGSFIGGLTGNATTAINAQLAQKVNYGNTNILYIDPNATNTTFAIGHRELPWLNIATAATTISNLNGTPCIIEFAAGTTNYTPDLWQCTLTNVSFRANGATIITSPNPTNTGGNQSVFCVYGASSIDGGTWISHPTNSVQAQIFVFPDLPGLQANVRTRNAIFDGWTDCIGGIWTGGGNSADVQNCSFNIFWTTANFGNITTGRPATNNTFNFCNNTVDMYMTNDVYMSSNLLAGVTLVGPQSSCDYFKCSFNTMKVHSKTPTNYAGASNQVTFIQLGAASATSTAYTNFNIIGPNTFNWDRQYTTNVVEVALLSPATSGYKDQLYLIGPMDYGRVQFTQRTNLVPTIQGNGSASLQVNAYLFDWGWIPQSPTAPSKATNWWIGTFTNGVLTAIATNVASGGYIIIPISTMLQSALTNNQVGPVVIFGDGSKTNEFVYSSSGAILSSNANGVATAAGGNINAKTFYGGADGLTNVSSLALVWGTTNIYPHITNGTVTWNTNAP
jgi:hypothetical protein